VSEVVRALIEVHAPASDRWEVRVSLPGRPGRPVWPAPRVLARTAIGDAYFPTLHPEALGAAAAGAIPAAAGVPLSRRAPVTIGADVAAALGVAVGEPHTDLALGRDMPRLKELHDRVTRRALTVKQGEARTFGRYLFDTLIGSTVWNWIVGHTSREDLLEVALAWDAGDVHLHRLNWEMMHGPNTFLAAKQRTGAREVAITRVIAGTNVPLRSAGPVPRCLFVVGASLTDARIRPGAELLGLLRQIERSERALRGRVLRGRGGKGATPRDVMRAMREFAPDFVHLVCHGVFDDSGAASLELGKDPEDPEEPGVPLHPTGKVFDYLNAGREPPSLVVLSACNTGQSAAPALFASEVAEATETTEVAMRGAHETAPMAAQLVTLGIPVVVGMAGRVADRACRHFSRRFGEALVQGEALVCATAQGRRAAFVEGEQPPEESVDWAFPAVFMAANVDASYVPAPRDPAREPPVEKWVRAYHTTRGKEPAFCGRHEFFEAYYDLFDPERVSVLGIYVSGGAGSSDPESSDGDRRHGLTRLLKEMAVQAIRDGHLPVVVSNDGGNEEPPTTLTALVHRLFRALNHAKATYAVDVPPWQIGLLADMAHGDNVVLPPALNDVYREEERAITARVVRAALAADMTALLRAAQKHDFVKETRGTAILMLDDVDKYPVEFLDRWLDGKVLSAGGVRGTVPLPSDPWDPDTTVLPVVMTFKTGGAPPDVVIKAVKESGSTLKWMRLERLDPFPPDFDVDLLAMQNVLLNPYDEKGKLRPGISNRPFALNHQADADTWTFWTGQFRDDYCGLPGYFEKRMFYKQVEIASKYAFLKDADDETRLAEYMKADAGK
jgi:hypothetical protein